MNSINLFIISMCISVYAPLYSIWMLIKWAIMFYHISGIMVSVIALTVDDLGFVQRLVQSKTYRFVCAVMKEEFEDTKRIIRMRQSEDRQRYGQKKKDKPGSTKHTPKTRDRVTRTPLKTGVELNCSGRVSSSCSTSGTRRVNLVTKPVISHEWEKENGG
jgi:hypothetical protein